MDATNYSVIVDQLLNSMNFYLKNRLRQTLSNVTKTYSEL